MCLESRARKTERVSQSRVHVDVCRVSSRVGLQGWLVSVERFGLSLPTVQNLG